VFSIEQEGGRVKVVVTEAEEKSEVESESCVVTYYGPA
jgi:hypothetical protein